MADFVKVMEEARRMCGSMKSCGECPLFAAADGTFGKECGIQNLLRDNELMAAKQVEEEILNWADDNPKITAEDLLFRKLPGVRKQADGRIIICPDMICNRLPPFCEFDRQPNPARCRACWAREVPEERKD